MEVRIAGVTNISMISLNDYQTVKNFDICNTVFAFATRGTLDAKCT